MPRLSKLFYVHPRQELPRLRRRLSNGLKMDEEDKAVHLLVEAGVARDWTNARRMVKSSQKSPQDLFWELTAQYRPNWKRRLRFWLIRLIGAYPYNPHASELRDLEGGDS